MHSLHTYTVIRDGIPHKLEINISGTRFRCVITKRPAELMYDYTSFDPDLDQSPIHAPVPMTLSQCILFAYEFLGVLPSGHAQITEHDIVPDFRARPAEPA